MRETAVAKRARARKILTLLQRAYPGREDRAELLRRRSSCSWPRSSPRSARTSGSTWSRPGLFRKYPTARALATADPMKLEGDIRSTGFFRAKTRSLLGMARGLVERHGGVVPADRDALTALPGVGLKTANVVLGNAFGQDALAVDTHVFRVSQRLGLAKLRGRRGDPRSAGRRPAAGPADPGHAPVDHSRPADLRGTQARVPEVLGAGPLPVARQDPVLTPAVS